MIDASDKGYRQRSCKRRSHLTRAKERFETCFILTAGVLVRERQLDDGRRQILGLHVPGDVCGLTALCDGYADHDVVALTPVSCIPIDCRWLSSLTRESGDLSEAVWREMLRETAISDAWTFNLGQRSAYDRLVYFLCELEARLRAAGQDMSSGIEWPGSQSDLGAITGLSLVHVNKTLRQMKTDKLASCGRRLRFQEMAKLRKIVGFDPTYLALERETLSDVLLSRVGAFDGTRSQTVSRPLPQEERPQ